MQWNYSRREDDYKTLRNGLYVAYVCHNGFDYDWAVYTVQQWTLSKLGLKVEPIKSGRADYATATNECEEYFMAGAK